MSITQIGNHKYEDEMQDRDFEVTCDICGELAVYTALEWQELMDKMKEDGWVNKKRGEEWIHHCNVCDEQIQKRLNR